MSQLITRITLCFITVLPLTFVNAEKCTLRDDSAQFYISDTHVGMGGRCSDNSCIDGWNNMEDFRWHDDFLKFTNFIQHKVPASIDLVIVGDFLELWQSTNTKLICGGSQQDKRSDLGCNSEQATNRILEVKKNHSKFFNTLINFLENTNKKNKLILMPGNHDAAFSMQHVAKKFKDTFPDSTSTNICIEEDGILDYSYSAKNILIEHGHQIEGDLNRYKNPTNGVVQCIDSQNKPIDCNNKNAFIKRSWGENFVQNFYNDNEILYPIIDNYSFEPSGFPDGIKRGLKAANLKEISTTLLEFGSFLFFEQTFNHLGSLLNIDNKAITKKCIEDLKEPCVDINKIKSLSIEDKLFSDLPEEMKTTINLLFNYQKNHSTIIENIYSEYPQSSEIIDDIIISTCIYWDNLDSPKCSYQNLALGTAGTGISEFFKKILNKNHSKIYEHIIKREADQNLKFDYFIYGHTHKAQSFKHLDKNILNTGAWQRVASSKAIANKIKKCVKNRGISEDKCFRSMSPSILPACYSYVANMPKKNPQLLWWAKKTDGSFGQFLHKDRPENCK